MTRFGDLLSPDEIARIGWCLLHFAWQGAALAALLAAALALLRSAAPQARYLTACAALVLMVACPALTWVSLRTSPPPAGSPTIPQPTHWLGNERHPVMSLGPAAPQPAQAPWERWRDARSLEPLLPGLVSLWFMGVVILSSRLFGGWIVVERLRRCGTQPLTGPLDRRVREFARQLGIRAPIRLLETARLQAPAVVGWLRPAILVPAGALMGLPPAQLEALIAHELAHIRRCDYFVNLLQCVVETLLFYHPAVWWVSRQVRLEREHCCDELAVALLGDRVAYARALTDLAALLVTAPVWAMAGSGGDLPARIRRIVGRPVEPAGLAPAALGGVTIVFLTLAAILYFQVSPAFSAHPARQSAAPNPSRAAVVLSVRERPASPGAQARPRTRPPNAGLPAAKAAVRVQETAAKAPASASGPAGQSGSPAVAAATADKREASAARDDTRAAAAAPAGAEAPEAARASSEKASAEAAERAAAKSLAEAEARRAQEETARAREAEQRQRERAREETRRALEKTRRDVERARVEDRRALQQARIQERVQRAVAEARAQDPTRREPNQAQIQEQVRRALAEARPEIERAREEARREIERARPEIERARGEARRAIERARPEIERAQVEARRAIERARPEIERAREEARRNRGEARPGQERALTEEQQRELDNALRELDNVWPEVQRATEQALRELDRIWPEVDRATRNALRDLDRIGPEVQRAVEEALRATDKAQRDQERPGPNRRQRR